MRDTAAMHVDTPEFRRFVPFGSHWSMGIDVPYSLGVIDRGRFWSCGQCPLDRGAGVLAPGDLEHQLRLTAGLIRDQLCPHGIDPGRIVKLVAHVVPDGRTGLGRVAPILRDELAGVALVLPVGVPHFYYEGMMVEIDVYAGLDARPAGSVVAIERGVSADLVRSGDLLHDVVKQQTYYVGGASAEDLYANMRVRNGYYQKPGPASTGLAVHGFADSRRRITIELLAAARS